MSNQDLSGYSLDQLKQIVENAPDGAEYYMRFGALYYKIESRVFATSNGDWFASNFKSLKHLLTKNPLKLSDIRAELIHRKELALGLAGKYPEGCQSGADNVLDYMIKNPKEALSHHLSDSAKNDTQTDLSIKNDSQNISDDFKTKVKSLALSNGFKLKAQPDGSTDLNPYVYEFAAALVSDEMKLKPSIQAYFASDERGSIEQEQSVIEPTHMKCALLRDSSLEKLQWLINESLANGWTLVGAVVSAGIHNDTFVATMMKVAGDE